jgi:hypothetical protein
VLAWASTVAARSPPRSRRAPAAHQRQEEVGADAGGVEVVDALAAELRLALLALKFEPSVVKSTNGAT